MRKFLFKIILLFLVLLALDQCLGHLADYYFFKTRDGDTGGQINGLLTKRAPILIFGSSRAEGQYVPDVLGASLGKDVFNGGFKGSSSLYDYAVLRLVLENYTPELIVYDFSVQTIGKSSDPYSKLYPLYPFRKSPTVWDLLKKRGRLESIFFLSKLYPYNSKLHSILMFNILKCRPGAYNGYYPQSSVMQPTPLLEQKEMDEIDPLMIDYYRKFISLAKGQGIKIVVVCSPRYSKGPYVIPEGVIQYLDDMSVPFLDFNLEDYPQFNDYKLYKDLDHLNDTGAVIFSTLLGKKIRELHLIPSDQKNAHHEKILK